MARNFNGSTDEINLPTTDALANLATYTLLVVAKTTADIGDTHPVYGEGNSANNTVMISTLYNQPSAGRLRFIHRDDASVIASIQTGAIGINDGNWHRVVVVRKASNSFEMWLDGVSQGTSSAAPGTTTIDGIGIGRLPRLADEHFPGDISFVARWPVAISDAAALRLSSPTGPLPWGVSPIDLTGLWPVWGLHSPEIDLSGKGHDGTVVGTSRSNGPPITLFTPKWAATIPLIEAGGGIVLLDGTAAAVSSLAGALPVDKALGGTVPAVAALAGDLPVSRLMVSTVAAVSSLAGALPVDKGLAATIPATSGLTGALALEWALAGTVPAVSTLTGDLTVPGEIVLSGVIPATSSLAGELPVERLMVSTIAAASTLEAILGKYRAINGSIDAVSTVTGDLQILRALAGAIAGGSTLAGALKLEWALRGILAGLATVSGELTVELGFPWKREHLLTARDISGPALRAPHKKELE